MAYPPAYTRTASFTDWETTNPGEPKPGVDLDTEFDDVSNALTGTQDNLALIQRADGQLANESVGVDQLQEGLFDGIGEAAAADAEAAAAAAAASAAAAATSATGAAASATAASTSAGTAAGAAAAAGVAQGVAQTAAIDAGTAADDAGDAADAAELAANTTANSVAQAQLHEETAFKWAEYLAAPVMPAPDGWPEAVDDGMWSSKWWALRARDFNSVHEIDLGPGGEADIGEAFVAWDVANDLPTGLIYATWGTPPLTYALTGDDPADADSWTLITGGPGPAGPPNTLTIGTVAAGVPTSATITGTAPNQVLNLVIEPGATGATGATGPAGAAGAAGPPNTLSIGTVTTGAPGSSAAASITGAAPTQTLSLTIPRGDVGATGATGATGPAGPTNYADPTGTIGLTAVNGVGTTTMRSDAAPPLSQAIVPTWSGDHTFNATVDLAGPVEASGVEGLNGQVLASQGAGLPLVFRNAGSGSIELGYNFAVAVGTADPGNQKLSLNSAVYASVTQIQFDDLAFGNFDATTILSLLTSGNRIYIQARADATRAVVYEVTGVGTDNGGHWSIPVSIIASRGALFAANSDLTCVFILSSSSISVANPTATIGLTAVNGSATTAMRSDGAPALSQAISPTWTGAHTWSNTTPTLTFAETDQAADETKWKLVVSGKNFTLRAYTDSESSSVSFLTAARGAGTNISSISFGDAITSPNYNFLGAGTATFNGAIVGVGATGGAQGAGTVNATGLYVNGVAVSGGAPGGSTTQVQYNNSGAFAGSATFTWDNATSALKLGSTALPPTIAANSNAGAGVALVLQGGAATAAGTGGGVGINAGVPTDGNGGGISITAAAGVGTNRSGGGLFLTAGNQTGTGTGGVVRITAGGLATGTQGAINFRTGTGGVDRLFINGDGSWGLAAAATVGTSGQVLTSQAAAPPIWSNPALVAANFANPTASLGLTAVNGSAITAMRSDAAPALSQAIAPTWTAGHTFSLAISNLTGPIVLASGTPGWIINETDQATDGKYWRQYVAGGILSWQVIDDAAASARNFLVVTRSLGAVASVQFGNATNNPTYTFLGTGTITSGGVLLGPNGAAGAPTYSFSNDPNTGIYSYTADVLAISTAGVVSGIFSGGLFSIGDGAIAGDRIRMRTSAATAAGTSYHHYMSAGVTQLDMYAYDGAVTTGGTLSIRYAKTWFADGLVGAPAISFAADTDTGIYRTGANSIGFAANGVQQAIINASGSYFADGTAALPGISFLTDGDTGIYRAAANTIGFAALAAVRMTLSDTALVASVPVQIANGTNAAPSFAFSGDTDTGIYYASSGMLGFANNGSTGATLSRGVLVLYGGAAGVTNTSYVELRDSASTLIGYMGDVGGADNAVGLFASVAGANIQLTPGSGGTVSAPSYTTTSSRAIKRETGAVRSARDILSRLRPLLYRLLGEGEPEQLGLIAEEVREVCPQLSNGKSVAYDRLAILLLAAWQEEHA